MNDRDGALVLPVALASGAIGIAYLPFELLTRPPDVAPITASVTGFVAILQLGIGLIAWRAPERRGSMLLTVTTLLSVFNCLKTLYFVGDPAETMYLTLLCLAAGAILLSRPSLGVVLGSAMSGWLLLVIARGSAAWTNQGMILGVSIVVAVLVQGLRRRAIARDMALTQATRESEQRYRSLVESSPDAILVTRADRWVFVNDAAVKLFGARTREELVAADPTGRLRERDADKIAVRLDNFEVPVEIVDLGITWDGEPARQSIVRDLTLRRAAEAEAREVERLRELDRVKTRFLNAVSHELRTPLTPMRMQLHILRHPSATPEARAKAIEVVDRNVARMGGIVEDLLEVARVEAGRVELKRAPLDLRGIVEETLESFDAAADAQAVLLTARIEGPLPVVGDERRLTQVLYNLVGNAMKFTPRGGRILVRARRDGDEAVVLVEDNGAGLDAADIGRLFEPFSQAHDSMQRTHSGTGLGLYISRGYVEAHGGSIGCESDGLGLGSRFWFRLPLGTRQDAGDLAQGVAR